MNKNIHDYQDIIHLPYQKSKRHRPMARLDRAAQFAPFSALPGHKEAIEETARTTELKRILDENKKTLLNQALQEILFTISTHPVVKLTYFIKDPSKDGGSYNTMINSIKKIDEYQRTLIFMDKTKIRIDDIYEIELLHENI